MVSRLQFQYSDTQTINTEQKKSRPGKYLFLNGDLTLSKQ